MTTQLMNICEILLTIYGEDYQTSKYIEECAESIVAISHFREGKTNNREVVGELVDVYFTLTQMIMLHDKNELFGDILVEKINRIKERIMADLPKIEINKLEDESFDDIMGYLEERGAYTVGFDKVSDGTAILTIVDNGTKEIIGDTWDLTK